MGGNSSHGVHPMPVGKTVIITGGNTGTVDEEYLQSLLIQLFYFNNAHTPGPFFILNHYRTDPNKVCFF